jgi:hypothetical protein
MFSHTINNPNNFVIKNDYTVVPFGHRCSTAIACKYANIRKMSLPFDWTIPALPKKIQNALEDNFDNFIPDVHNGDFHSKYGFYIAYFNSNINNSIEEYKRRIDRLKCIMNETKHIYFVYINEDYLYNDEYRQDDFNDRVFNEMLELEKFIKDKYININYNILYFNFKHHNIPTNSNIINVILKTAHLYNVESHSPYRQLRNYCGEILANLFNTNFTIVDDISVIHE